MLVASVANDNGDNEMIPGTVHRSPDICLRAFLQMRSVGSQSTSGKEKGGKNKMMGWGYLIRLKGKLERISQDCMHTVTENWEQQK
jgi:hypothetical protein